MDEELYFVDTRNAGDHRVPVTRPAQVIRVPAVAATPAPVSTGTRVTYAGPPQSFAYPAQYGSMVAPQFWGPPAPPYSQGPIYGLPWMSQLGGLFGGLGLGDVIKFASDALASFKSLPGAPSPTGDVATDVANAVVYLTALSKDMADRKKFEFAGELAAGLAGRLPYGWGLGAR